MRIRDSFRLRRNNHTPVPAPLPTTQPLPVPATPTLSQAAPKSTPPPTTHHSSPESSRYTSAPAAVSTSIRTQAAPTPAGPVASPSLRNSSSPSSCSTAVPAKDSTATTHSRTPSPTRSSSTQPSCALFRLPRELRDRIYAHLLTAPTALLLPSDAQSLHLTPALLRTCRQLYSEATPLLYSLNRFTFAHPSDLAAFRSLSDALHSPALTSVALRVRERELRLWKRYLEGADRSYCVAADLPHVRHLVVFLRQGWWSAATDVEANLRAWLQNARVRALCKELEGRLPRAAEVTVVSSVRVPEPHFEALARGSFGLRPWGECYLRSGAVPCPGVDGVRCVLELLSPEAAYASG